jgi:hypothetical protein
MFIFAVLHTPVTSAPNDLAICTGEQPYAAGRTVDQYRLPWLDLAWAAESLTRGTRGRGDGCRLLEGEVCRLRRELVCSSTCVVGKGAAADAEYLVARLKSRHGFADRLDGPRDIHTSNTRLGRAEPEAHDAHQAWLARHHVPVTDVHASRVNAQEHVVVADLRLLDLLEPENVR